MEKKKKFEVTFVCGNVNKMLEVKAILDCNKFEITYKNKELPEHQGDLDFICIQKCKAAASIVNGPVMVEDTALCFRALEGLPGPYIKCFHKRLGSARLAQLLAGFDDKFATAVCTYAFTEGPGKDVYLFTGNVDGYIVEPRGDRGFGWDNCFIPESTHKTYAEMTLEEKNAISPRKKALDKLKMHFNKLQNAHPVSDISLD